MNTLEAALNFKDAVEYHYDGFPPAPLDYGQLIAPLAKATDAVARYDQMLKAMHNSDILLAPLRKQEAVISSRMEGTISTMDEILQYEADYDENSDGTENQNHYRHEIVETHLYYRALRAAQKAIMDGRPISAWLIRAAHRELLFFGRGAEKSPGEFKTEQNYLVDRTKRNVQFIPIRPEKLQDGLDRLFGYMEESPEQILIKTAIAHVEFEALHPFKDGNGRIGRMLIPLMLWKAGTITAPHFYISGYLEEEKDNYIDFMRDVSARGAWTEWCVFFLTAIEQQAIRNLKIAEEIKALYDEMKEIFRDVLSSRWHTSALDFIFTNPYFRNNKFKHDSGIPPQTAARFTRVLLEHNLIRTIEEPAGRRPALYSFEPLLKLVRV